MDFAPGRGGSERTGAGDLAAIGCGSGCAARSDTPGDGETDFSLVSAAPVDPKTKVLLRFAFFVGVDAAGRGACEAIVVACGAAVAGPAVVGGSWAGVGVSGASSGARLMKYRRRVMGSTAENPSSKSSIEKPVIGAWSSRSARAAWSARCHDSESTQYACLSILPIELTSTNQRMMKKRKPTANDRASQQSFPCARSRLRPFARARDR
jgi:hypothetical protein